MSRIITVFGATGNQGSSVVNAILADGTFVPRAVTRDVSSESALKLKARGAEVVQADFSDVESLKKAIAGSEGVFGITNPVHYGTGISEIDQGKNLIAASKAVGVKFFVFSSLENTTKISHGKYPNLTHFEHKAVVEDRLKEASLPHAIVHTGWFAENLWNHGALVRTPEGPLQLRIPRSSPTHIQPITWVTKDLGPSVLALFKNYETKKDIWSQTYCVLTTEVSYPEFAEIIQKAIGKPVSFNSLPTSGIPQMDETYDYLSEFGMYRGSTIPDPRLIALGVQFGTLEEFAETEVKPRFS